jgi:hypothetical protein
MNEMAIYVQEDSWEQESSSSAALSKKKSHQKAEEIDSDSETDVYKKKRGNEVSSPLIRRTFTHDFLFFCFPFPPLLQSYAKIFNSYP